MSPAVPRFGAGDCPVGCGRAVSAGNLLCGLCWSSIPVDVRRWVYKTWAKYKSAKTPDAVRTARAAYTEARDAAIASVR